MEELVKISHEKLREYMEDWYDPPYDHNVHGIRVLNNMEDVSGSGTGSLLVAYMCSCLNRQFGLGLKVYWIQYGDNYEYHHDKVFTSYVDAFYWADNGPYDPWDKSLFEKYRVVTI